MPFCYGSANTFLMLALLNMGHLSFIYRVKFMHYCFSLFPQVWQWPCCGFTWVSRVQCSFCSVRRSSSRWQFCSSMVGNQINKGERKATSQECLIYQRLMMQAEKYLSFGYCGIRFLLQAKKETGSKEFSHILQNTSHKCSPSLMRSLLQCNLAPPKDHL